MKYTQLIEISKVSADSHTFICLSDKSIPWTLTMFFGVAADELDNKRIQFDQIKKLNQYSVLLNS